MRGLGIIRLNCPKCDKVLRVNHVTDNNSLNVVCPSCNFKFKLNPLTVPRVLTRVPLGKLKTPCNVTCLKCKHKWVYNGVGNYRVRCPVCHSSQNSLNRDMFGKWLLKP